MRRIFIDADSCPKAAREMVLRFSERLGIKAIFVANRQIPGIKIPGIKNPGILDEASQTMALMEICGPEEGSADRRIAEMAEAGDLVLTRDLPLAEKLVEAGIRVIDDRGRVFTKENIKQLRSVRDFVVGLAESGLGIERTASYGKKELNAFANSLDRELSKLIKNS